MASNREMRRLLIRIAAWIGATLVLALVSGVALQWILSHRTFRDTPPPGTLIDVGGHRIHILCQGDGGPTVILETGLPGTSLAWESVTSDIAGFARVCTYDRAGYAWSESGPSPRTAGTIVQELHLLLQRAGAEPPYVLVGHSFGGLAAQLYASRFPDEVAGMVLVDSSHPDQVSQSASLESATALGNVIRVLGPLGIPRFFFPVPAGSPESRDESVLAAEEQLLKTTRSLRTTAAELAALRESLRQVAADRPNLRGKPLVVLTEGRRKARFWHEMQADLANLSSASHSEIVEGAGHFIHHDRPDAVVSAVRRVVEALRPESG